jgi:hypothetical protein
MAGPSSPKYQEVTASIRHHDKDDLGTKSLEDFLSDITTEIRERSL